MSAPGESLVDRLLANRPLAELMLDPAEQWLLERAAALPPTADLRGALERRVRRRVLQMLGLDADGPLL